MEKQPETEIETFEKIFLQFWGSEKCEDSFKDWLFKGYTTFHTERKKIEAQQVVVVSLEECKDLAVYEENKILDFDKPDDIYKSFEHFKNTNSTDPDWIEDVLSRAAELYASACVSEKEKEIDKYKEVLLYTHKRIHELESSQAVVSDEDIEQKVRCILENLYKGLSTYVNEWHDSSQAEQLQEIAYAEVELTTFIRSKLLPPSPNKS